MSLVICRDSQLSVDATDLVHRFFRALDEKDDEAAAKCFSDDGIWLRQGATLQGPNEIANILSQRKPDRETIHLVTNLMFEIDRDGGMLGKYLLTGYAGDGSTPMSLVTILDCTDKFVTVDQMLRIAHKSSQRRM